MWCFLIVICYLSFITMKFIFSFSLFFHLVFLFWVATSYAQDIPLCPKSSASTYSVRLPFGPESVPSCAVRSLRFTLSNASEIFVIISGLSNDSFLSRSVPLQLSIQSCAASSNRSINTIVRVLLAPEDGVFARGFSLPAGSYEIYVQPYREFGDPRPLPPIPRHSKFFRSIASSPHQSHQINPFRFRQQYISYVHASKHCQSSGHETRRSEWGHTCHTSISK